MPRLLEMTSETESQQKPFRNTNYVEMDKIYCFFLNINFRLYNLLKLELHIFVHICSRIVYLIYFIYTLPLL